MLNKEYKKRVLQLTQQFMINDKSLSAVEARSKAIMKANFEVEIENEKPAKNSCIKGSHND